MSELATMEMIIKSTLYDASEKNRKRYTNNLTHLKEWYKSQEKGATDDQKAMTMLAIAMFFTEISHHEGNPPWLKEEDKTNA